MEKRNIQIDLDTARNWYLSRDSFKQELALKAFSKEELERPKLPNNWDEFTNSNLCSEHYDYYMERQTLKQLLILRDIYRQGWKPDWEDSSKVKWCIVPANKTTEKCEFRIINNITIPRIFSFDNLEIAEKFLDNFNSDLKILKTFL